MNDRPWLLQCEDYTSSHKSREEAEAQKASVEKFGACRFPHKVVFNPQGAPNEEEEW